MDQENDWQLQQGRLRNRATYILKNGLWSDCQFYVGEGRKEFKAHKFILSMASPVFEKMFQNGFNETQGGVEVVDIQPEAFEAMLSYVYGDIISIQSFEHACELCYVANKYMMPKLLEHCTSYISKKVNVSNACRGYEVAKLFDQQSLMEECREIIIKQTSEVISQASFVDVEMTTLKMILEEPNLCIPEIKLFEAVKNWTEAEFLRLGAVDDVERRTSIYDELVPKICFLGMNPKEFAEGPAVSALLTKDQAFAILMNILSRNCGYPMPKGFTTEIRGIGKGHTSRRVSLSLKLRRWNTSYYNNYCKESILHLTCNENVQIFGVKLSCEVSDCSARYDESVDIFIVDGSGASTSSSFDTSVDPAVSEMEVLFKSPVPVIPHQKYALYLVLKGPGPGRYWAGKCRPQELIHGTTKFTLTYSSDPSFITKIIFSK